MKGNLVIKLQEFTRKFKINEEEYYHKFKELAGEDSIALDSKSNLNNDFLRYKEADESLRIRDAEINALCNSIEELASIFKDLQTLVLEQGTILDRIDYNIDSAAHHTKDANKQLVIADKNMSSNCSRNMNLTLLVIIFILSLLIMFKILKKF
jgi:t-SNARE complex subunit (syntaxin)